MEREEIVRGGQIESERGQIENGRERTREMR